MKAGDKVTIGGITLKAEPRGSEHICKGYLCECSDLNMENCWDEEGNGLIFKEEEYIEAHNHLHGDYSKYCLKSNYKIQPSIMNFYTVFDVSGDSPVWVRCFYGLRKAVNYVLMRDKREGL